jgi:putative OPT family oligopeptide transporter
VVVLCFLGGVLGLSAMIPLRRLLIVQAHDELPYPEGTACAEVLRATAAGATGSAWIFRGMAVGAGVKLLVSLLFLVPNDVGMALPVLPKAEVALELAPALIGVGFILGYRQSAVCVAGAIISALALTPLIAWLGAGLAGSALSRDDAPRLADERRGDLVRYVRYIGAGAVATAGILTVLRGLPSMLGPSWPLRGGCEAVRRQRARRLGRTGIFPAPSSPAASSSSSWRRPSFRGVSPETWARCRERSARPGSESSGSSSWPWRPGSSGSSGSRRSRPRASPW